jgi:hypothetical protein
MPPGVGVFRSDPQPQVAPPRVPAAALTTGSQPPRIARQLATMMATVGMSWPQQGEPTLLQRIPGRSQVVPLTLTYGQQPPTIGPLALEDVVVTRAAWPETHEPPLPVEPSVRRRYIVALTLDYGDAPPITGPLTAVEYALMRQLLEPPRPVIGSEPPPPVKIVPLTLTYGNQPARIGPLTPTELALAVRSWEPGPPRMLPPVVSAGWDVPPPVVNQPKPWTRLAAAIPIAWLPPDPVPPRPVSLAPLTLTYGQQPPNVGPLSMLEQLLIGLAWTSPASLRAPIGSAAWDVPVSAPAYVPWTAPARMPLEAWYPTPWPILERPTYLESVDRPIPHRSRMVLHAWYPPPPMVRRDPTAPIPRTDLPQKRSAPWQQLLVNRAWDEPQRIVRARILYTLASQLGIYHLALSPTGVIVPASALTLIMPPSVLSIIVPASATSVIYP